MTLILTLIGLASISLIGLMLAKSINKELSIFDSLGLGYLLGMGLFTYLMFFSNLIGFSYNASNTIKLILLSFLFISLFFIRRKSKFKISFLYSKLRLDNQELFFSLVIVFVVFAVFIASLYWPVKDWDSIVLYDFRAKVFLDTGSMFRAIQEGYFFGYPLMTSLSHLVVYLFGFKQPGIIHSLFYISFLFIFFSQLKNELNRKQALFWTMILSLTPELFGPANMTYTNLAYEVYLLSSLFFLFRWVKTNNDSFILISALLLGLSTWVRSSEPFWLILLLFVITIALLKKKWHLVLGFPLIVYCFVFPWQKFETIHSGNASSPLSKTPEFFNLITQGFDFSKIIGVTNYFLVNIILPNKLAYILFILTFILLLLKRKKAHLVHWLSVLFIIFSLVFTFIGIYLFSLFYQDWTNIGGSATRMTMFIIPSIIYSSSIVFNLLDEKLHPLNIFYLAKPKK